MKPEKPFWNPYVAGFALGLVLLASFLLLGKGLGASGAASRVGVAMVNSVAPDHVAANSYLSRSTLAGSPLDHRLVFLVFGVFLGGLVAAYTGGRLGRRVYRGPHISPKARLALALSGGVLMGIAARLALGCTSGQALTGGALLSAGSWMFMMSMFMGGYGFAWFMRRQWL